MSCTSAGLRVRFVRFRKLPEGNDVSDWLYTQPAKSRRESLRKLVVHSRPLSGMVTLKDLRNAMLRNSDSANALAPEPYGSIASHQ
jgi:hypothetical protein